MQNVLTTDFHFTITDIQTVTFPLPSYFKLARTRSFFVSVSDGRITKNTRAALLDQKSLHWSENLDGFTVDSSSQVTLKFLEIHHTFRKNVHFVTFVIPYEILRSSRNATVQCVDNSSPSREIRVTWCESCITSAEADSHNVGEMRSRFQNIKEEAVKMTSTSELADEVVNVSESLETAGQVASFVYDKCKIISGQLDFVIRAVDAIADVHPYAKMALSVIMFIPKTISEQIKLDQDVLDLLIEIEIALDLAPDEDTLRSRCQKSDRHEKTLTRLLDQINECGHFIQSYVKDVNFGKRLLKNLLGDGKTVVDNFRQVLKKLREDFISDVIVTVETNVIRILAGMESISETVTEVGKDIKEVKEKVDKIDENVKGVDLTVKLQNLPYGKGTNFNLETRNCCLPQTRVKILNEIMDWVNNPSSSRVLLLFGQAGTGKSSIAHEIAHRFRNLDRLTTSYGFVKGEPSSRECYRFFTTLTRNLWHKYPAFRIVLNNVINNNPGLVEMRAYTTLFESLLRDPLKDVCFVGPVFIVIDALDESEDASDTRPRNTLAFHDFLATRLGELPSNFRILVTSRPEPDLLKAFPESSFVHRMDMNDVKFRADLIGDLLIYMHTKLNGVEGITEGNLQQLVAKAEGNFQWAFVACSYITRPPSGLDSQRCIQRVLQPTTINSGMALNPLYELYTTILQRFNMEDPDVCNDFTFVMTQILGAFAPLSVDTLKQFVSPKDATKISVIISNLGSLLSHVTPLESDLPVAPLHTSFRDFLTDKRRSGVYYLDLNNVHDNFALATLRTMQGELKFNKCKLETSYLLNSEVPDLEERIANNISSALSYSCYFWANHLRASKFNLEVFKFLEGFMKKRFLFWLEVLSVRGEVSIAQRALLSLQGWLNQIHNQVEIKEIYALVEDAIAFVRYFGFPIVQSAPHIYLSALSFSPSSSVVSKIYTPQFSTLRFHDGRLAKWPALEMSIDLTRVHCVAWSRNDEYIAAAENRKIHVRSTSTGEPLVELSFNEDVVSIAMSHNGQWLAVGLKNGRNWILEMMEYKGRELEGHWRDLKGKSVAVSAVAFAEDDKRLVLGLGDCTVRIWDLEKAEEVGEPFIGHSHPVWAVSFLDQEHIVSRSGFRMVLVWNVKTRERVTRTDVPTGTIHTAVHRSRGFFVDESRVKSSFDVCSWAEATEDAYGENWESSFYDSLTAAFSTDGTLVATCSPDHVHVWHTNGSLAGGPFSVRGVVCLAFSADGQRIASGSHDGLRVWNIQLVDEDGNESNDKQEPSSMAFMSDGENIVVGRKGGSVEVLDALTGREVVKIAEGNNGRRWRTTVSLNDNWIASATDECIHIWTRTGEAVAGPLTSNGETHRDNMIETLALSPGSSGLVAYTTFGGTVCVLSASTGALIGRKEWNGRDHVSSLAFSPAGSTSMQTHLAVGIGKELFMWDTLTDEVAGPFTPHCDSVSTLMFSSDGRHITSVAKDGTLCLWDSSNGKIARGPVTAAAVRGSIEWQDGDTKFVLGSLAVLALDGRKVAFRGIKNTILLFDVLYQGDSDIVLHNKLVLAGHTNFLSSFAFSTDGRYLATSYDRTIKIWDLRTALKRKRLLGSASEEVMNLDEGWINRDGWFTPTNGVDAYQPLQRLFWVPDIHRSGLHRPSCVSVIGGRRETRLDIDSFHHGEKWEECLVDDMELFN